MKKLPYTKQLHAATLLAGLAIVLFFMASYFLPDISPLSEPSSIEVALVGIVLIGMLLSGVLAFAFLVSTIMWKINGGEPAEGSMPLGKRLKGAGLILLIALGAYAALMVIN